MPSIAPDDLEDLAPGGAAPLSAQGDRWTWSHYLRLLDAER